MDIVIWDSDAARITRIDRNVHLAMRALGLRGLVTSMSEPPLLGRMGLLGRVPVLEIEGNYWSLEPDQDISEEQCRSLLSRFLPAAAPGGE